jgi:poly-gamma-glutamate capsule biosynthesis protein CapA/YwtB (metallophosphatase superfamily)
MINDGKIRRKMDCGGALRHPQSIFRILTLLCLLVSCSASRPTVRLALLGDLMLGRGVQAAPDSLAYLAPELEAADISFANLESPLAEAPPATGTGKGYNLCAPSGRVELLSAWGLDLLSIVNNHRFDCGPDGPTETADILRAADIHPVASGLDIIYSEINRLKLAFLAFEDVTAPLDEKAARQEILQARQYGALVIVSIHWGVEYQAGPTARQKALAQQFAQAGAALVVGTHPHVLQPAEWIETQQGKTLVLYSLGNALFDQPGLPDTRQSALVVVTLDADGVQSVRLVPFVIDVPLSRLQAPDAQAEQQIHERIQLP